MSISTYAELKTAVGTWRRRSGATVLSTNAADFVTLAEARLTRVLRLRVMWSNTTLTGTTDVRTLALPATFAEAAWLVRTDTEPYKEIPKNTSEGMVYYSASGQPTEWCINGTNIDLNRPCSSALGFLFRYRAKFALSDASPTNWLLTNHPDIYLAAVLVWSGLLTKNQDIAHWSDVLNSGINELIVHDAESEADVELTVDPMLLSNGRYDITTDSFI